MKLRTIITTLILSLSLIAASFALVPLASAHVATPAPSASCHHPTLVPDTKTVVEEIDRNPNGTLASDYDALVKIHNHGSCRVLRNTKYKVTDNVDNTCVILPESDVQSSIHGLLSFVVQLVNCNEQTILITIESDDNAQIAYHVIVKIRIE